MVEMCIRDSSLLEQRLLLYTAGKAGLRTVARHAEQQQVEMHALQFPVSYTHLRA